MNPIAAAPPSAVRVARTGVRHRLPAPEGHPHRMASVEGGVDGRLSLQLAQHLPSGPGGAPLPAATERPSA